MDGCCVLRQALKGAGGDGGLKIQGPKKMTGSLSKFIQLTIIKPIWLSVRQLLDITEIVSLKLQKEKCSTSKTDGIRMILDKPK